MRSLRIFYAAHTSPNPTRFASSRLWHENLFVPLQELGHDLVQFDFDLTPHVLHLDPAEPHKRKFIRQNRHILEDALVMQIEAAHRVKPIDVSFSYFYNALIRPETVRKIHDLGITTVNWYCNAAHQFHLVSEVAPAYDYSLVPEEFRLGDYRRIGARPIYCQMAANPSVYRPYNLPVEFDVAFVGQRYGDRPLYIRALIDAGLDTHVWGPGWLPDAPTMSSAARWKNRARLLGTAAGWRAIANRLRSAGRPRSAMADPYYVPTAACGPALSDLELIQMYSRARVHLGFSSVGETHAEGTRILQVRLREFEAPMSGAFYVTEYMPELRHFYEIGRELVCYESVADLVDKTRYYLAHDAEREAIRVAGYERARRDHTWHRRFETVFAEMGFA